MELFTRIGQLLLSLVLLVALHELGHFIAARYFKTRVEKFYLFFNPWFSLFKIKKGNTEYGLGWLPLGGYVKIAGMIDESMDKEQMKEAPKPDEFRSKKTWQRLIIILAGVFVNLILACIISIGSVYTWGETYLPNESLSHGIVCNSVAQEAGFLNGDKIIEIDGDKIERFSDIMKTIYTGNAKRVLVNRKGENIIISLKKDFIKSLLANSSSSFKVENIFAPRYLFAPFVIEKVMPNTAASKSNLRVGDEILKINNISFRYYDEFQKYLQACVNKHISLEISRNGNTQTVDFQMEASPIMGIALSLTGREQLKLNQKQFSLTESIPMGLKRAYAMLENYIGGMGLIFSKEGAKHIGGIGTMAHLFPTYWNWQIFWNITSFLSLMFAFLNILPIPGLDGGHAIFIIYEMLSGKKPSLKFMEVVQTIGVLFLISLIIFANGNDLFRFFN